VPYFDGSAVPAVFPSVGGGATGMADPLPIPAQAGLRTLPGSQGTLLAVVPAEDGRSHLAIIGYLVPGPSPYGPPDAKQATASVAPAGLVVDRGQHRVLVAGRDAGLGFQEFELLEFLMAHPNRAFTRVQLLASVWTGEREVSTRTVDIHVHRLRRKLGPAIAPCLVTVRRVGYMFRLSQLGVQGP
jgi:DNA-binding response OmpR family regulator